MLKKLLLLMFLLLCMNTISYASKADDARAAIEALRSLPMDELLELAKTDRVKANKLWDENVKIIQTSWSTIENAGYDGASELDFRLKSALRDNNPEKEVFFKLNGASLLWKIRKLHAAETIGQVWSSTPLDKHYNNYVFYTALEAANTRDSKALPMLLPLLGNRKGEASMYPFTVNWESARDIIWGAYGVTSLPSILELLQNNATDPLKRIDCLYVVSRYHYLEALPTVRQLAAKNNKEVKIEAIRALGRYAHPSDKVFLLNTLKIQKDEEIINACLWALGQGKYTDTVSEIKPFFNAKELYVREAAYTALRVMKTRESIELLLQQLKTAPIETDKDILHKILGGLRFDPDEYDKLSNSEKNQLFLSDYEDLFRKRENLKYEEPRNRELLEKKFEEIKRADFLPRMLSAINQKRLPTYGVLEKAKVEDLPLMYELRSAIYGKPSKVLMYEVYLLEVFINKLVQKNYKQQAGAK